MIKVSPSAFSFLKNYYFLAKNEAMTFLSLLVIYLLISNIIDLLVFSQTFISFE